MSMHYAVVSVSCIYKFVITKNDGTKYSQILLQNTNYINYANFFDYAQFA